MSRWTPWHPSLSTCHVWQAKVEIHKGYTPLIILEGFLLLEDETVCGPMMTDDDD